MHYVFWRVKCCQGHRPLHDSEKAIRLGLVSMQSTQELLHLGRRWIKAGELITQLIDRQGLFIALPFVVAK